MLRNIMEGKYSFTSPEWADISGESMMKLIKSKWYIFFNAFPTEDPKDLIRKCLVVDPAQRITVKEVLRHPFFNQMVSVGLLQISRSPRHIKYEYITYFSQVQVYTIFIYNYLVLLSSHTRIENLIEIDS